MLLKLPEEIIGKTWRGSSLSPSIRGTLMPEAPKPRAHISKLRSSRVSVSGWVQLCVAVVLSGGCLESSWFPYAAVFSLHRHRRALVGSLAFMVPTVLLFLHCTQTKDTHTHTPG